MSLGFWLYLGCALPWAACLIAYGTRSPWQQSWTGRAMFTTYAALTAVLGLAALLRVVHLRHALTVPLAVFVLVAVAVAGAVQLVLILRLQRRDIAIVPRRRSTDL